MDKLLGALSEFVNKCLGPLGSEGFTADTIRDLIIQLAATLILFLVVRFFLWNKVTALLEGRRAIIDGNLQEAQEAKERALELESKLQADLDASKVQIQTLIANAVKEGSALKADIIAEAKVEAQNRLDNATSEIEYEIKKQSNQVKEEIVSIAFMVAEKIVSHEVDKEKYMKIVTDLIESGLKDE